MATNPTAGKLDPKWEGGWVVNKVNSPPTLQTEHRKSQRSRVVHINRIWRCILREESTLSREVEWEPASIQHFSVPTDSTPQPEIVREIPPAVPLPNEQFLDNVADIPQAVQPPIDLAGQAAPPTVDQAQRHYPQREQRPPNYY